MEINGKTILITGASSGIGYELAKQLSKEGCNLILLARRKETLDELAEELKSESKTILMFCAQGTEICHSLRHIIHVV